MGNLLQFLVIFIIIVRIKQSIISFEVGTHIDLTYRSKTEIYAVLPETSVHQMFYV